MALHESHFSELSILLYEGIINCVLDVAEMIRAERSRVWAWAWEVLRGEEHLSFNMTAPSLLSPPPRQSGNMPQLRRGRGQEN